MTSKCKTCGNGKKLKEKIKEVNRLKQRLKDYDTGLIPTQRKKYEEMREELKLTNEAYSDVCIERDNLRKTCRKILKKELCPSCSNQSSVTTDTPVDTANRNEAGTQSPPGVYIERAAKLDKEGIRAVCGTEEEYSDYVKNLEGTSTLSDKMVECGEPYSLHTKDVQEFIRRRNRLDMMLRKKEITWNDYIDERNDLAGSKLT